MRKRNYSDQAVILARKNYSEADRILILFSKNNGKVAMIAKGVRKPKSRKRGHLEVFNQIKFSAVKTKGLDIITEVQVLCSFPKIRKSLKKVSLAYYFTEVVGKTTREGKSSTKVYNLLTDSLSQLEKKNNLKQIRLDFLHDLLVILGFWPKGKKLIDPDKKLEEVVERSINSKRVGKILFEE